MNILIQGYGVVGKTVHEGLQKLGHSHFDFHDPIKALTISENNIDLAHALFYCVNDKDGVISDLSLISRMNNKLVIIKTTVKVGETKRLQDEYPEVMFVFMPEFLREKSPLEDFLNPEFVVYGAVEPEYSVLASDIFINLKAPRFFVTSEEAELIKLCSNSYPLIKLVFFNQIYDHCQKIGANYDKIAEVLSLSMFNSGTYMKINDKNGRGGGGKCLPKDMHILMDSLTDDDLITWLADISEINARYLKKSGKE